MQDLFYAIEHEANLGKETVGVFNTPKRKKTSPQKVGVVTTAAMSNNTNALEDPPCQERQFSLICLDI